MPESFSLKFRTNSLRIILFALLLSVLGHLLLFLGIPFFSFGSPPEIVDDLIIKTDLRVEPPKKIQQSKRPNKPTAIDKLSSA